jgi:hypothetical protein
MVATLLSVSVAPVVKGQDTADDIGLLAAAFRELIRLANNDAPQVEPVPIFCLGLGRRLSEVRDPPAILFARIADVEQPLLPSSACTDPPLQPGPSRYAVRVRESDRVASLLYLRFEGDPVADTVVTVVLKQYVGPRWASVWRCAAVATESGWTMAACRLFEEA